MDLCWAIWLAGISKEYHCISKLQAEGAYIKSIATFDSMKMSLHFKHSFFLSVMLLVITAGCKTVTPTVTVAEPRVITCGTGVPNNEIRPKNAVITIYMEHDSLNTAHAPADGIEFYRVTDSLTVPMNLYKELYAHMRYPEMLRENDIQGKWIYEMSFDQQLLTSWTLKKGVENGMVMEKEIDRVLTKLKRDMRYFSKDKTTRIITFKVVLEEWD